MVELILCATQRCGSTMIVEDMRNTGVMGKPEEWFLPWDPEKPDVNWQQSLQGVRKRATGENNIFSVKVMANQLANTNACLANITKAKGDGLYPHFAETFRKAKWVKLERRDIVSQAISRVMARQTGVNHATANADDDHFAGNLTKGYDDKYNQNTVYQYDAILQECTAITLENLAWNKFFNSNGLRPITIVYEAVVADKSMGHLDRLTKLIGLPDIVEHAERKMVKLGNNRNNSWHKQFFKDAEKAGFKPL